MKFSKTAAYVIGFLILLVFFFAKDAAADSELSGTVGSAVIRGATPVVGLVVKWREAGPGKTDFELGTQLTARSEHEGKGHKPNASVYGLLVADRGPFEMGIGLALHNNPEPYHCSPSYALMAGAKRGRHGLRWLHFSTGDSCEPNSGRDFVNYVYRF